MPHSTTSAFSEPIDFQAALRDVGSLSLFVTAPGKFHARLTQVSLHNLRLSVVEENSARIGFLGVPSNEVIVSFPLHDQPAPIWGGMTLRAGELIIIGPGHRLHVRTEGPTRWGAIWLPEQDLANYFLELTGCTLKISPFAQVWRPPAAVDRRRLHLHGAAIRSAEARPNTIVSTEAAHGMEQQLIESLVECLFEARPDDQISTWRNQGIMARFEDLLNARQEWHLRVDELCVASGVSARLLRLRCREALGMSPISYIRLRALHAVHEILRNRGLEAANVSHIARCHGFFQHGRFAATYRSLFGELPSATLRRTRASKLLISRRAGGARLHEICQ